MLSLKMTNQFRKDLKLAKKRGLNTQKLEQVLQTLLEKTPLDIRYRDHALTGDYIGFRECHVEPDWLLVYIVDHGQLILTASRTGTHSDLFY